jgi:hydrogenase maturation protease
MTGAPGRVLVVGVGNAARGDDAAGVLAARFVEARVGGAATSAGRVEVAVIEGDLLRLLDFWRDAAAVVVVDAVITGAPVGTVTRFDLGGGPVPASLRFASTHAFSVAGVVELARALGRLPARAILYGIEARAFADGAPPSVEVAGAAVRAADAIAHEIETWFRPPRAA